MKRVSDEAVVAAYAEGRTLDGAAAILGITRTSIHERLVKIGIERSNNRPFSESERLRLGAEYLLFRDSGKLADLSAAMGRPKTSICREARALGLTDQSRAKPWFNVWKGISPEAARVWMDRFKRASGTLSDFCKRQGIDDLGFSRTMRQHFPDEYEHVIESKVPRQSMYRLGRAFEYRVRDHLKSLGYFVLRSPASKSPVDLVAIRPRTVLLVQCKRGGQIGVPEWNAFYSLATSVEAIPVLAEMKVPSGVRYARMVGAKDGTKRRQPMAPFNPNQPGVEIEITELDQRVPVETPAAQEVML